MSKSVLGFLAKTFAVARAAQCAGARRPHTGRVHVTQTLAEAGQAFECPDSCSRTQVPVPRQSFGKANRFSQSINYCQLAKAQLTNDHVETVGSEIDGSNDFWRRGSARVLFCVCRIGGRGANDENPAVLSCA
jgi:hypothetical protein